jgi:hypothetical protein
MLSFSQDYHKIKTKIRRLYDIANVLQALHLIEKTLLPTRKPGFKWLGYKGFRAFFDRAREIDEIEEKAPKIFLISQEPTKNPIEQTNTRPKFFKPKVLQLNASPLTAMGKRLRPEMNDKEKLQLLSGKHGAFTKFNGISKINIIMSRLEEKIQNKRRRVLINSQIINLVP